jgi:hypothetical protein
MAAVLLVTFATGAVFYVNVAGQLTAGAHADLADHVQDGASIVALWVDANGNTVGQNFRKPQFQETPSVHDFSPSTTIACSRTSVRQYNLADRVAGSPAVESGDTGRVTEYLRATASQSGAGVHAIHSVDSGSGEVLAGTGGNVTERDERFVVEEAVLDWIATWYRRPGLHDEALIDWQDARGFGPPEAGDLQESLADVYDDPTELP